MNTNPRERVIAPPSDKRQIWEQFRDDRELIARLSITPNEIDMLERCSLLGTLTSKQDLLFILRQIREATGPITARGLVELRPVPEPGSFFEEPVLPVLRTHITPAALRLTEPSSFEALVRGRWPEHLGISVWALVLIGGLMWNLAILLYRWREHFLTGAIAPPSPQSMSWLARFDDFSVLIGWEILFVGCILGVAVLRSRRRHRRLKVRPT
jgi:hypothetical protein